MESRIYARPLNQQGKSPKVEPVLLRKAPGHYFRNLMELHDVYLCIGGNLGKRDENLEETRMFIKFNIGDLSAESPIYETDAWEMENAPAFLNQVLHVRTTMSPQELMTEITEIEEFFGRKRKPGIVQSREMDVDILFYDNMISDDPKLQIPHPRLHFRKFVLVPLNEISGDFIHPVLNKKISDLLAECSDTAKVQLFQ